MKNFLIAFVVFMIWSVFGMWYYTCIVQGLCVDENNVITQDVSNNQDEIKLSEINERYTNNSPVDQEGILDDKIIEFPFPDNLAIKSNSTAVNFPNGTTDFNESIFNFLNNNQDKELVITGLFNSKESNNNGELGLLRAESVKEQLVNFGINPDRISIENKFQDYSYDASGKFIGGLQFRFAKISTEKLKSIESGIANKTLYSGFGSKEFIPDNTLQAYALELKNYLTKYPDKNAEIIGHTDSTGDEEANDWYGMERAKNVQSFLVYQGISSNRLKASTKGEKEPVATNTTLEGRRKNRRIEIRVK